MSEEIQKWQERNPLYRHRLKNNMTFADTATWLGVSVNTIHAWEDGRSTPEPNNMEMLKGLIGGDVEDKWLRWSKSKPQFDPARK